MRSRRSLVLAALALAAMSAGLAGGSGPASADTVSITVGDNWFCDAAFSGGYCETTITAGDSIVWDYAAGSTVHTTTECGASCDTPTGTPDWDSGIMSPGDTFSFTFTSPGAFLYYCTVHPFDMRGRVFVEAAAEPSPSPTPTEAPQVTPTPPPGQTPTPEPSDGETTVEDVGGGPVAVPSSGGPPPSDRGTSGWAIVLIAGGAVLAAGMVALGLARQRSGR